MGTKQTKYVVITPVRNEEAYIELTIQSMIDQTVTPMEWVIVNDGSTDRTGEIIDSYAASTPWIKHVNRTDRGFRKSGGGVIEAFYDGYDVLSKDGWEYIVKLDGDLSFQKDYFEKCFERFSENEKLGIGGGDIYNRIDDRFELEKMPHFHVRGATKIYRMECWKDIGRLIVAPGWDGLDEVKANMRGWETYSFHELKVLHYRYTGDADGAWRISVKYGLSDYISGYHPLFMLLKCIKRLISKPYLVGSAGHVYGYISGYMKKIPQVNDPELIQYLRQQQLRKLTFRATIWK
jgi:poly-beta-1,6-N-acetyl-D-glucosamine synthase